VIARGTADELKEQVGGDRLEVRVRRTDDLARAAGVLGEVTGHRPHVDADRLIVTASSDGGTAQLLAAGRRLEAELVALDDLGIRRPSLDDVFLALTGVTRSDDDWNES
jgi:ABC-2 type transport system ATP-binding protein